MTDTLLKTVEAKITALLSELERARQELAILRQENAALKSEHEGQDRKLHGLISLLDNFSGEHDRQLLISNELSLVHNEEEVTDF